jgi:hypothetical protein
MRVQIERAVCQLLINRDYTQNPGHRVNERHRLFSPLKVLADP